MAEGACGGGKGLWHGDKGQTGNKERCFTQDRLPHVLEHARKLEDLIPARKKKLDPLPRPSLQRPSSVTVKLLSEIMKKLYTPDGRLNTYLIVSNLALCDPTHDILLVEDSDHYNLLHKAIIFGDLELLKLLLDHGVDPNGLKSEEVCGRGHEKCPHKNLGALQLASFLGHSDLVRCLLDHGASTSLQMAVYTSAVVNDQFRLQPMIFTSALKNQTVDLLLTCGCRPSIFFAILNNQLKTVQDLLHVQGKRTESPTNDNTFLCHLACRFKAYECFEYLLKEYPQAINTKDTDGRPLLHIAIFTEKLKFVKVLLDHDCDIHNWQVDDNFQPRTNILHILLGLGGLATNDLISLKEVTEECLKRGVDVNEQRTTSYSTPLHVLMQSINRHWTGPNQGQTGETFHETLEQLDKELKGCMTALLNYGADIHIEDSKCQTPLHILLSNIEHMHPYIWSITDNLSCNMMEAHRSRSYGLDNIIECAERLIALGAIQQDTKLPIIESFIKSLISLSFGTVMYTLYPFKILEDDVIFEKYVQLLKILLDAGADPNVSSESKLLPLFSLLQSVKESSFGRMITVETAHRLLTLIHLLIENGATTEAGIGPGRHEIGCFDMLKGLIQAINKGSSQQTPDVLHTLATGLIQGGAATNVYENIFQLDDIPVERRANNGRPMHQHTFLYQYLMFGMLNLKYVNEGQWYMNIFNVLYCQIEHSLLHDVLAMAQAQFLQRHDYVDCECKSCDNFRLLLDSVREKPRSLKVLCRLAVYNSVKGKLVFTVPCLPLPPALKSYLMSFKP